MSEILEYVPSKNGRKKVGVMYADKSESGEVVIGFSLCNPLDEFRKEAGIGKAKKRAWVNKDKDLVAVKYSNSDVVVDRARDYSLSIVDDTHVIIPKTMVSHVKQFVARCKQYYKDGKLPTWAINMFDSLDELDNMVESRRHKFCEPVNMN